MCVLMCSVQILLHTAYAVHTSCSVCTYIQHLYPGAEGGGGGGGKLWVDQRKKCADICDVLQ